VIDGDGNAGSLILSIFADFGSGVVTDETGILLNSRLSGFFLDEDHPNGLRPGKKTMHTLHSVMVCGPCGPMMAGGSPGGDAQPQVNLQILCRVLFRNEDIAQAAGEPRWMLFPGTAPSDLQGGPEPEIRCEPDLDAESRRLFEQAGFRTTVMPRADIGSAKWSCAAGRGSSPPPATPAAMGPYGRNRGANRIGSSARVRCCQKQT
jgi:gamma-glutamyltranspeptidase